MNIKESLINLYLEIKENKFKKKNELFFVGDNKIEIKENQEMIKIIWLMKINKLLQKHMVCDIVINYFIIIIEIVINVKSNFKIKLR